MNAIAHIAASGALGLSGTCCAAQTSDHDVACLTTNVLSEKAICAWERYTEENVALIRRINKALIVVDAYQADMEPDAPSKARDMLVASHEAWLAHREQTCTLEAHLYFGGSGESLAYSTCLYRLTAQRNEDLRVVLEED